MVGSILVESALAEFVVQVTLSQRPESGSWHSQATSRPQHRRCRQIWSSSAVPPTLRFFATINASPAHTVESIPMCKWEIRSNLHPYTPPAACSVELWPPV